MAEVHQLQQKKVLPYVLCVEGNIGSGKSTLLQNLSRHGFTVIEEPVNDVWGQYLPRLYQDLKRWGFCFQMEAMDWFRQLQSKKFEHLLLKMKEKDGYKSPIKQRQNDENKEEEWSEDENGGDSNNLSLCASPKKQLLASPNKSELNKVIIVERSALSAITIFAQNLLDTQMMTEWEYSLLERFYSMIAWEPMHILYVRVDPEICCQRITKRNRDGEGNVDPVLIQNLHNKHEKLFNSKDERKHISNQQNIITVDGRKSSQFVLEEALRKINKIQIEY